MATEKFTNTGEGRYGDPDKQRQQILREQCMLRDKARYNIIALQPELSRGTGPLSARMEEYRKDHPKEGTNIGRERIIGDYYHAVYTILGDNVGMAPVLAGHILGSSPDGASDNNEGEFQALRDRISLGMFYAAEEYKPGSDGPLPGYFLRAAFNALDQPTTPSTSQTRPE